MNYVILRANDELEEIGMANIKLKDINKLETWNTKELRKLRMTTRNRISALETSNSPKTLPDNHPLFEMDIEDCKALLERIQTTEREMAKA